MEVKYFKEDKRYELVVSPEDAKRLSNGLPTRTYLGEDKGYLIVVPDKYSSNPVAEKRNGVLDRAKKGLRIQVDNSNLLRILGLKEKMQHILSYKDGTAVRTDNSQGISEGYFTIRLGKN